MKIHFKDGVWESPVPVIMGILNITSDSFSDGGKFLNTHDALLQAERLISEGADIIDIGGESTRPGAKTISAQEEIDRIMPVIREIKKKRNIRISVDTYKAEVARTVVKEGGVDIINDISALRFSLEMAETVAALQVPAVLMHILGTPQNMQDNPRYKNVIEEICQYFSERIDHAANCGIPREKLIIDPGIGFGKRLEDNIAIIRNLAEFHRFGLPVLLGVSRKSFLGKISGETIPEKRNAETIAAHLAGLLAGADILRVHEVQPLVTAIRVFRALYSFQKEK